MLTPIIGATIATTGYEAMAHEAAARFRRFSGCHCLILTADGRDGYGLKMALPQMAAGRVTIFFDADLFFIRQIPVRELVGMDGLAAVADPAARHDTFCRRDAEALGFDPKRYVNTGLMVFNAADSRVQKAFDEASVFLDHKKAGAYTQVEDVTEQSLLNLALHRNQLPTRWLPPEWNTYLHAAQFGHIDSIPARPYCIHAAGIPLDRKYELLKKQCSVFEWA